MEQMARPIPPPPQKKMPSIVAREIETFGHETFAQFLPFDSDGALTKRGPLKRPWRRVADCPTELFGDNLKHAVSKLMDASDAAQIKHTRQALRAAADFQIQQLQQEIAHRRHMIVFQDEQEILLQAQVDRIVDDAESYREDADCLEEFDPHTHLCES
jgi:hypothetical protein